MADPARHAHELVQRIEAQHRIGCDIDDEPLAWLGLARTGRLGLDHLHRNLDAVRAAHIAGDVAVCGVGHGASTLFAAAFLQAHEEDPRPARQRRFWVLDRFRRSDGGADLNLVRDRLDRFGLLDQRVRLLQGDPAASASEVAGRQLALLVLGPDLSVEDVDHVLDNLYPRLTECGIVVVEGGNRSLLDAVECYRVGRGVSAPVEWDPSGGLAWAKRDPKDEPLATVRTAGAGVSRAPLVRPARLRVPPDLSVVMVVHNMRREAERSLRSLSPAFQEGLDGRSYEVLVVENGSDPEQRLGSALVEASGGQFRYIDMGSNATASPAPAMNRGLADSRGRSVALMIDGAHILTPRVLHYGLAGLEAYEPAVVATQAWYVGPGQQGDVMRAGYDQVVEDALFERIGWPGDGYRLFEIGQLAGDRDWFDGLWESNCLFVPRTLLERVGGFDEAFAMPGGGYTNLDLYERLASTPGVHVVTILGEGSFHQLHGGTTTNQADPLERRRRVRSYTEHYAELRGRPFVGPEKPIQFVGGFHTDFAKRSRGRRMTAHAFDIDPRLEGEDGPAPSAPVPVPDDLRDAFTVAHFRSLSWRDTRWLGHSVPNAATDLVTYQEILAEVRPDWIIETGTQEGGRAWFFATICELLGHGRVISVAQRQRDERPTHPRLQYVAAAPHTPEARERVCRIVGPNPHALVILGSRTRRDPTRREFESFAPLVPVGSYVIIEHTVLNGFPVDASFGPGPHDALRRLMNVHGEFLADSTRERHALTFNQGGFLRRIA